MHGQKQFTRSVGMLSVGTKNNHYSCSTDRACARSITLYVFLINTEFAIHNTGPYFDVNWYGSNDRFHLFFWLKIFSINATFPDRAASKSSCSFPIENMGQRNQQSQRTRKRHISTVSLDHYCNVTCEIITATKMDL